MLTFPNAKINLGLNVVSKRADGYHNIESCFYPIGWLDCLEVLQADSFGLHCYGLNIPGVPGANLCEQAYRLLQKEHGLPPVVIHLLKQIPMGAGLGGGSADGAFTLLALNELFELKLSQAQLEAYSLQLGSDCPFFVGNTPAIARGRGERLTPLALDISGYYIALKAFNIHVSTQAAYSGITPSPATVPIEAIGSRPIHTWKEWLINDFEATVFAQHPELSTLKQAMYDAGALYASMTGSGSAIYGLFKEPPLKNGWKVLAL